MRSLSARRLSARRRSARRLPGALSVALFLASPIAIAVVAPPPTARADVVTISSDPMRTGWDGAEPGLTAQSVASDGFGQLFATKVDGQVYAEPVIADGVLVAATENNAVYGLDPATGAVEWHTSLGEPWPTAGVTCADLTPNAGVTSTPVVADGVVYLTSKTWNGSDPSTVTWRMHALDITTGAEEPGWPVALAGNPTNDPDHAFAPQNQLQRSGLLLMGGVVYAAFASSCDNPPTRGYVMGVRTGSSPALTTIWTSAPTDPVTGQTGIWMSGSGIMSDGDGRMFVATGNGTPPPYDAPASTATTFGDSVVRLDVQSDGSLQAADYFTPSSAVGLAGLDRDFGSGGVVGLPDSFGTPAHPHLAVAAGKDGRFFLLDRDRLGGRAHADADPGAVAVYGAYRGQFSHAAAWSGAGGWVYTTEVGGPLRAWHAGVDGDGDPALTMAGTTAANLPFGSGSPVVTSDGADGSDALVWVVDGSTTAQPIGSLQAYDAVPDASGTLALRWSAPIGFAGKFSVAATDNGRVYVGTRGDDAGGTIYGFGRLTPLPVTAAPWDAGTVSVGQPTTGDVTVSVPVDGTAVRIASADATGPFTVDAASFPTTAIQPGSAVRLPVTFAPTRSGTARGVVRMHVEAATGDPNASVVAVDVGGYGAPAAGVVATPAVVDLGAQPVELPATASVELRNPGTDAATLTSLTVDGGFHLIGAPALPATIAAGGSLAVRVTVVPTAFGAFTGHLVATADGTTTTVPLTGTGTGALARLKIDAPSLSAGVVTVAKSAPVTVRITNIGFGPTTVTAATLYGGDFTATGGFATGVQIQPEQTVTETLTFRPRAPGPQTATLRFLTTIGGSPSHLVVSGYGAGALPALDRSMWRLGGRAAISSHVAVLTPFLPNVAGSAIYVRQVHTKGLRAAFQAYLGDGRGGSGITFAILGSPPGSVGWAGAGMGVGGLAAVAVTLDTEQDPGDPSAHFTGVVVAHAHGRMSYVARHNLGPGLRTGWHNIVVREYGGRLLMSLDGNAVLSVPVTLPAQAWLGFTAGTGSSYEWNEVRAANITVG